MVPGTGVRQVSVYNLPLSPQKSTLHPIDLCFAGRTPVASGGLVTSPGRAFGSPCDVLWPMGRACDISRSGEGAMTGFLGTCVVITVENLPLSQQAQDPRSRREPGGLDRAASGVQVH